LNASVADGVLKKLYDRIRSQRENWQQRSLLESRDVDTEVGGSHGESAAHKDSTEEGGYLTLCICSACSFACSKLLADICYKK